MNDFQHSSTLTWLCDGLSMWHTLILKPQKSRTTKTLNFTCTSNVTGLVDVGVLFFLFLRSSSCYHCYHLLRLLHRQQVLALHHYYHYYNNHHTATTTTTTTPTTTTIATTTTTTTTITTTTTTTTTSCRRCRPPICDSCRSCRCSLALTVTDAGAEAPYLHKFPRLTCLNCHGR